jgi:hypothetical protein
MIRRTLFFLLTFCGVFLTACNDDDDFDSRRSDLLTFETDTLTMDTVFSNVGSSTYTFWVYNHTERGIRLSTVRLRGGSQTGFRVNVDGTYLDNTQGSVAANLELRSGDSLRVFVELTSPATGRQEPQQVVDDLVFRHESGAEQRVRLEAWAWDALKLTDFVVSHDTLIESATPIILYGKGLCVDSSATLTLRATTLFFHDGAGIDVYGRLSAEGCVLRGDRLDHMFDYLPYDRVSGQWRGVHIAASSTGNAMVDTEIRNALTAIDLTDSLGRDTLTTALTMTRCVVHNAKGDGVVACGAKLLLSYCQLTNTLGDCLRLNGGVATVDHTTLAQFYPFSADRGAALRFVGNGPLRLVCTNSILTGYADDVLMGEPGDTTLLFSYSFSNCLLRTPAVEDDSVNFRNIIWETPKDSVQGAKHFVNIDEENLYYDFHLDSLSTAWGKGCY